MMTTTHYTCDDCGRDDLTALGLIMCCSPLNSDDDLNN